MAQKTRAQLELYFQTGDIPTQSQFAEVFESCVNITDDNFTKVNETTLVESLGFATADCSLGKSFRLDVTGNVTVDASNMKVGETYTFFFVQASGGSAAVTLRSTAFISSGFAMVSGDGNTSMIQCYCTLDVSQEEKLFVFDQKDLTL